jgi:hypothetical protein
MSDNKNMAGSPDNKRIDLSDPKEIWNWTKSLGVDEDKLRSAVEAVGNSADKVRDYLGDNK